MKTFAHYTESEELLNIILIHTSAVFERRLCCIVETVCTPSLHVTYLFDRHLQTAETYQIRKNEGVFINIANFVLIACKRNE